MSLAGLLFLYLLSFVVVLLLCMTGIWNPGKSADALLGHIYGPLVNFITHSPKLSKAFDELLKFFEHNRAHR